jgi:adenylosuccinate lyase
MRAASQIVLKKAAQVIKNLSDFADRYKSLPCLAYTHLQPAQLTTVGKRATLWMYELSSDIEELQHRLDKLLLLGSKGTTGTQASFMELFGGDEQKVKQLEKIIADDMGFAGCVAVSGQTYSRKVDAYFLSVLSGFAQSAYKFANDLRILQSFEEMEEPFGKDQIGSSAMPYKRNPMRSERICALARYVIIDSLNPAVTASTQWFERTLDDSANKRISVAEAFLAVDAILNIYMNVTEGLVVYDRVVTRRVMEKLPFMATEDIMMESVKRGGNRQELHERLRVHSHAAAAKVKLDGGANDLIDRIAADDAFPLTREEIESHLDPSKYIGRCVSQVEEFIRDIAAPIIDRYYEETHAELSV